MYKYYEKIINNVYYLEIFNYTIFILINTLLSTVVVRRKHVAQKYLKYFEHLQEGKKHNKSNFRIRFSERLIHFIILTNGFRLF